MKPFKDLNDIGQEQTVNTRTLQHRAETSEWGPYGRASHSSNRSYWPKRMNLVLPNYGNPMSILDPKASEYMDDQIVSLAKHLQYYVRKLSWEKKRRFGFYARNVQTLLNSSNEITLQGVLQVMY